MDIKRKILTIVLIILFVLLILLLCFKFIYNNNVENKIGNLEILLTNEGYKLTGSSKKGEEGDYQVDHYYNEDEFVTCLIIYTENYDVAKNKLIILQEDYISTGYGVEEEINDNYTKLSIYGENGYFKISLAIDNYEFEIFTPKYQDKVEDIANKIIDYYSK